MIQVNIHPDQIPVNTTVEIQFEITNTGEGTCTHLVMDLTLPLSMVLIKGSRQFECTRLGPGEKVRSLLIVKARQVGQQVAQIHGLSFRRPDGRIHTIDQVDILLNVIPSTQESATPTFAFQVSLEANPYTLGEWGLLQGQILNQSNQTASGLQLSVEGPVQSEPTALPPLRANAAARFSLPIKPLQAGAAVPVNLQILAPTGAVLHQTRALLQITHPTDNRKTSPGSIVIQGSQVEITQGNRSQFSIGGNAVITRSQIGVGSEPPKDPPSCPQCGKVVIENANFCDACGAKLST